MYYVSPQHMHYIEIAMVTGFSYITEEAAGNMKIRKILDTVLPEIGGGSLLLFNFWQPLSSH